MKLALSLIGVGLAFSACMWMISASHPKAAVLLNGVVWVVVTIAANLLSSTHYQERGPDA